MRRRDAAAHHKQVVFSRQLVGEKAYRDLRKKEVVNVLSPMQIFRAVREKFGFVSLGVVCWEEGEVMADGRGSGSLQMMIH